MSDGLYTRLTCEGFDKTSSLNGELYSRFASLIAVTSGLQRQQVLDILHIFSFGSSQGNTSSRLALGL
jgi:hypothetical protein